MSVGGRDRGWRHRGGTLEMLSICTGRNGRRGWEGCGGRSRWSVDRWTFQFRQQSACHRRQPTPPAPRHGPIGIHVWTTRSPGDPVCLGSQSPCINSLLHVISHIASWHCTQTRLIGTERGQMFAFDLGVSILSSNCPLQPFIGITLMRTE